MLERVGPAEAAGAAEFVGRTSLALRWLVAFLQHLSGLPEESQAYWSLWQEGRSGRPECRAVLAHSFARGTSYLSATADLDPGEVEPLLRDELLPERLVGDAEGLEAWERRSKGFFRRARRRDELVVLALPPGPAAAARDPGGAFRAARPADEPRLRELERLYAGEMGEEEPDSDLGTLIRSDLVFAIEAGGEVAGMVRSNVSDGRYVHLGGLYVHPDHRRSGLGAGILAGLAARLHRSGLTALLDTSRANAPAIGASKAAGYREVGRGLTYVFPEDGPGGPG